MVIDEAARERRRGVIRRIINAVLFRIWYVGTPTVLMVKATPLDIVNNLRSAVKPRVSKLHLRKLYANGRRYFIQPNADGFLLRTTSKVVWHYRRRTSSSTVMRAEFSPFGDGVTRIQLQGRVKPGFMITNVSFLIPFFITSFLIYTPWHPIIIGVVLVVLYGLAWSAHRFNAQIEINEMVWFVQTTLEELVPAEIMTLGNGEEVIFDPHEFEIAWEKFYEAHRGEHTDIPDDD